MQSNIDLGKKLSHPGFVLFEGLDLTGKSFIARSAARYLRKTTGLDVRYNHNRGLITKCLLDADRVKEMDRKERIDYILQCYLQDTLPRDPREFHEIFQDKHAPAIIFYSIVTENRKLRDMFSCIARYARPKHVFLLESTYPDRLARAKSRKHLSSAETTSLSSEDEHKKCTDIYKLIIDAYKVSYTIIDTSTLSKQASIDRCISCSKELELLTHKVPVKELYVDFEPRVYSSTVQLKLEELRQKAGLAPILVTRQIDESGASVMVIQEGRHRAYAALRAEQPTIRSYVNHEPVPRINYSGLKKLSEFGFK